MTERDGAEIVALQALAWLAGNDELMPVFLGATGTSAEEMRAGAGDPSFLAAVLDFLLQDDAWVVEFSDEAGLPYEALQNARRGLPGGEAVHWT